MATAEEKQELVDNLKGKRYYRLQVYGYGGEHVYGKLTKEAYDFWKPIVEEHGDSDLCNYALNAEDGDFDFENINEVPPEADFLMSPGSDGNEWRSSWYEMPTEFEHINSVGVDSATINVEEVDSDEYNAKFIADVISNEGVNELIERVGESTDWEVELMESVDDLYPEKGTYIVQMLSMEKGTFYDAIVETVGDFDPSKLRITCSEAPNGEDVIHTIKYNGEELDNQGGDTNGKGYTAAVWQQEF
jgi:hypothetical protein